MKKLQILTLTTLTFGSYCMYGQPEHILDVQENRLEQEQAIQAAKEEVIHDLAEQEPSMIDKIIQDEDNLQDRFGIVQNFAAQLHKRIEKLSTQQTISQAEIARLAIELADTQAALERTIEKQRTKHRKQHKLEQKIKDSLMKTEQSLKNLQKKATPFIQDSVEYVQQATSKKNRVAAQKQITQHAQQVQKRIQDTVQSKRKSTQKQQVTDDNMMDQVTIQSIAPNLDEHIS